MKLAVAVVAGLLAIALGWVALRPRGIPADVAEVTAGPLRLTVDQEGRTRVRERYVVAAPADGRLLRLAVHEGDVVEPGTVVARIQPTPLDPRTRVVAEGRLEAARARKLEADAHAARARAAHEQARRTAERATRLHAGGMISEEEREQAALAERSRADELAAAEFAAHAAAHDLEAAQALLLGEAVVDSTVHPADCGAASPCLELHAPVAGRILRILQESERTVAAGTPLVEVGDPAALEVVVDVLSTEAVKVKPEAPVLIEDWGGSSTLHGRVRRVEPSGFTKLSALGVEEQRVNVIVDFVDPPGPLGDGYRVEARIVVWEAPSVVKVPSSALFRRGDAWYAFVVDGARARLRRVVVGGRGPFEAEVREGLAAGERVVLYPSDQVDDATRLDVRRRATP